MFSPKEGVGRFMRRLSPTHHEEKTPEQIVAELIEHYNHLRNTARPITPADDFAGKLNSRWGRLSNPRALFDFDETDNNPFFAVYTLAQNYHSSCEHNHNFFIIICKLMALECDRNYSILNWPTLITGIPTNAFPAHLSPLINALRQAASVYGTNVLAFSSELFIPFRELFNNQLSFCNLVLFFSKDGLLPLQDSQLLVEFFCTPHAMLNKSIDAYRALDQFSNWAFIKANLQLETAEMLIASGAEPYASENKKIKVTLTQFIYEIQTQKRIFLVLLAFFGKDNFIRKLFCLLEARQNPNATNNAWLAFGFEPVTNLVLNVKLDMLANLLQKALQTNDHEEKNAFLYRAYNLLCHKGTVLNDQAFTFAIMFALPLLDRPEYIVEREQIRLDSSMDSHALTVEIARKIEDLMHNARSKCAPSTPQTDPTQKRRSSLTPRARADVAQNLFDKPDTKTPERKLEGILQQFMSHTSPRRTRRAMTSPPAPIHERMPILSPAMGSPSPRKRAPSSAVSTAASLYSSPARLNLTQRLAEADESFHGARALVT